MFFFGILENVYRQWLNGLEISMPRDSKQCLPLEMRQYICCTSPTITCSISHSARFRCKYFCSEWCVVGYGIVGFVRLVYSLSQTKPNRQKWRRWPPMMTSSNGNIFRVTGPYCGEFTGHRWIPHTKASDAELWCFLWSSPEQMVE